MLVWIGLGILYFLALITLGVATLRNGHWVMFIFGIVFPLFWVIGALSAPTEAASRPAASGT